MPPPELPEPDLAETIRRFTEKGWRIDDVDGDRFMLVSPSGSTFTVDGIHLLPLDDEAPEFGMLSPERQLEETVAGELCELVVRYRFWTGQLFSEEQ
jgi:hypothetical protein